MQRMGTATAGSRRQNDFDFMFGSWKVQHRRLRARLEGCTEWEDFSGTSDTRPVLGGNGNLEDNLLDLPGGAYRALALRSLDAVRGQWAIWWLDGRSPHQLDVPVLGGFDGDLGSFYAEAETGGLPVRVRFLWRRGTVPRWEQAFSADGGATWETNWVMDFRRAG